MGRSPAGRVSDHVAIEMASRKAPRETASKQINAPPARIFFAHSKRVREFVKQGDDRQPPSEDDGVQRGEVAAPSAVTAVTSVRDQYRAWDSVSLGKVHQGRLELLLALFVSSAPWFGSGEPLGRREHFRA